MTIEEQTKTAYGVRLPLAEKRAIERHRHVLCETKGREVPFQEAFEDWLAHHASHWRQVWHEKCMRRQQEEMMRYKWIESEKARCDLGDKALFEWIRRYAHSWREEFERTAPIDAEESC